MCMENIQLIFRAVVISYIRTTFFFPQTNPLERITVDALMKDSWVQRGYGKSVDWKSRVNVRIIYVFNPLTHTTVSSYTYCYCTDVGSHRLFDVCVQKQL